MLTIPIKAFNKNNENERLVTLCDWIEGSIFFQHDQLSQIDIADVLLEEELYDDSDHAREMVNNAWLELQRRLHWIGYGCAFTVNDKWIQRSVTEWQEIPAHVFCTLLSLVPYYDWWISAFGRDYTEQGDLFEQLTKESLEAQFGGWTVSQTGWTRTNTGGLRQVVNEVTHRLGEKIGDIELWDEPNAKEFGLDLLWYRSFPDNRVGIPVYLIQCASGGNWESKLHTPNLDLWKSIVYFKNHPVKAFAVPFSFLDRQFNQNAILVKGLLLDRCRLLGASRHCETWVSPSLHNRLVAWAEPRVRVLLQRSM